jgi:isovaleryl-CoA dehydrogenase
VDFELDESHRMLRDTVHAWAAREIGPIAREIDRSDDFPMQLWPQMGELGLLGVTVPEAEGGAGFDLLAGVLVTEQIARESASVALSYGAHANLCVNNLYVNGTAEQRRQYLPPLISGNAVGALALTEPDAGSDAVGIQTTAARDGDDYVLNGTKLYITNGPIASTFVLYAKTAPEKGSHGISAFIVEKDFPGFTVARKLDKVGHRGSPTAELRLDDCRVPARNLLGRENEGVAVMMSGLDSERSFLAGEPLGIAQACLDASVSYAKERKQFGRPIGSFQLVQGMLADMYTELEAARWLVYRTAALAWSVQQNGGAGGRKVSKEAAAAILYSAEMSTRVALHAVQIFGGAGYMADAPVARYLRDAKLLEIGAGTSEIRRMLIARELLR